VPQSVTHAVVTLCNPCGGHMPSVEPKLDLL